MKAKFLATTIYKTKISFDKKQRKTVPIAKQLACTKKDKQSNRKTENQINRQKDRLTGKYRDSVQYRQAKLNCI